MSIPHIDSKKITEADLFDIDCHAKYLFYCMNTLRIYAVLSNTFLEVWLMLLTSINQIHQESFTYLIMYHLFKLHKQILKIYVCMCINAH